MSLLKFIGFASILLGSSLSMATTITCPYGETSSAKNVQIHGVFSISSDSKAYFKQVVNKESVYSLDCVPTSSKKVTLPLGASAAYSYLCSKENNAVLRVTYFRDSSTGNLLKILYLKNLTDLLEPVLQLNGCKITP